MDTIGATGSAVCARSRLSVRRVGVICLFMDFRITELARGKSLHFAFDEPPEVEFAF
jgi:hypothetical protein